MVAVAKHCVEPLSTPKRTVKRPPNVRSTLKPPHCPGATQGIWSTRLYGTSSVPSTDTTTSTPIMTAVASRPVARCTQAGAQCTSSHCSTGRTKSATAPAPNTMARNAASVLERTGRGRRGIALTRHGGYVCMHL